MTKKVVIVLVLVPLFLGLISLGVRLPSLGGFVNSGPKPRPRALVQNQIKNCKEKINKICQEQVTVVCSCYPQPDLVQASEYLLPMQPPVKLITHSSAISRAPPFS
jgi:hypothetical protein